MKTWLITGASKGLGKAFATAALERGDQVAVTARKLESLGFFTERYKDRALPLELEVTDKENNCQVFEKTAERFGKVDIVVNNAGYIQLGAMEETTEEQARREMETLFWGPYFMTQKAIPYFRKWGGGMFVQVSSLAGIGGLPGNSMYSAAKYALEGMSEALRREVAPFGIKVLILEPGGIQTHIGSGVDMSDPVPGYETTVGVQRTRFQTGGDSTAKGRAKLCAQRLLELVDMEEPPIRFLMSKSAAEMGIKIHSERLMEAVHWLNESVSISAEEQ